ncbi:uncharacterized protein LOC118404117 [Branchiostoma floridae]|uniref:Uncharacterized protein LOC118404117 n=1 Tax=Branchiostoma floridae TaxID=7739 RepID=A0A9J7HG33_BRAFL|nr:uncharacterized protein LOC118404117 [Branchiostoma floridae]
MKWYRLLALFITFVAALLIGAVVFKYLEETYHPGVPAPETTTPRPEGDELAVVEDFVSRKNLCVTSEELFELIDAVQQVRSASINQDFVNVTENVKNGTRRTPYKIGFFDSFFFCGTIATTIGYGHIYPFTDAGKVFCIAYALVSIPLTLFMLAGIGGKLGNANRWVENRVKRVIRRPYLIRVFMVLFIIIFGLGLFCFVPAYHHPCTVGEVEQPGRSVLRLHHAQHRRFGGHVCGAKPCQGTLALRPFGTRGAGLCWIVVGLSFLATVFDLIAEAMRGLKERLEEEMRSNQHLRQVTDFAGKFGHEAKDLAGKVGKVGSEVAHVASMPVKGIKKMAQGEGSKEKIKDGKETGKDDKKKGKDDKKKKATTPSEEDAIVGTEGSYKKTGSHENLPELDVPNGPEIPAQSQEVATDDQKIPQEGIQMEDIPVKEEGETAKKSPEDQPTDSTNQASDDTASPDVKELETKEPVKQEVPDMKPEVPKGKPEVPKGKPEVPKVKPEVPIGKPEVKEVTPEVPEGTSGEPEVIPAVPEAAIQSNENAAKPQEAEPAKVEHVDETSGSQEKTAGSEKESPAGKDDTAAAAEATETQDSTAKKQEDLDRFIVNMKWKSLAGLIVTFFLYLMIGAFVFMGVEKQPYVGNLTEVKMNFLRNKSGSIDMEDLDAFVEEVLQSVGVKTAIPPANFTAKPWPFYEALFVCGTMVTTIGYGHITPKTVGGQIFCAVYALFGIPVTLFMLTGIGEKLSNVSRFVEKKVRKRVSNQKLIRIINLLMSLVFGLGLFCFLPAYLFTIVEGWEYHTALYFVFITLTTVGFGDYIPAQHHHDHQAHDPYTDAVYKTAVFCWIIVGLTFLAGMFNLISEGLKELKNKVEDATMANLNTVKRLTTMAIDRGKSRDPSPHRSSSDLSESDQQPILSLLSSASSEKHLKVPQEANNGTSR